MLTDIVHYLIFAAYILMTANFAPQDDWDFTTGFVTAKQIQEW